MKDTCYRVNMTGCRVNIKGFGRVEKKVPKGGKKRMVKKTCFNGEKKGAPESASIFMLCSSPG